MSTMYAAPFSPQDFRPVPVTTASAPRVADELAREAFAMADCAQALAGLDKEARARVIAWLAAAEERSA